MKKILLAASECVPFIKTGGLADVVGSLPKYFSKKRIDARVILPKYTCIDRKYLDQLSYAGNFYMYFNGRDRYVGVMTLVLDGVTFYFLDNEEYFGGSSPYTDMRGDIEKFSFFSKAALSVLPMLGFRPDIIHCNDWHTGLIPVYLKTEFAAGPFFYGIKTIMTIHNLRFQGIWGMKELQAITGLRPDLFNACQLEFFGDANMLKGGIVFSDKTTTVSETYAREIMTSFYGERLDSLLRSKSNDVCGIVNGIDTVSFNPAKDPSIAKTYTTKNMIKSKAINKDALRSELGLSTDSSAMLIGIVSRLTDQKGLDLIGCVFEELLQDNLQFVILGTGDPKYENMFRSYAGRYPDKVAACLSYSEALAHRIYAGSDAFLMPSLFEPCGLSQLMALRYGSVPIVRETGGLKDTVIPYDETADTGTGFTFFDYNAHEMMNAIRRCEKVFFDRPEDFYKIALRGMKEDFSWTASAKKYEKLYESVTNN